MPTNTPWTEPAWQREAEDRIRAAIGEAGRTPTGPVKMVKKWGRSCLHTVATDRGVVWIKHGYGLPPGEDQVLGALADRWPDRVPRVVATWPGGVAMETVGGRELDVGDPVDDWVAAICAIAELEAGETEHADAWLAMGARDRRPPMWPGAVEALLDSPVVRALEPEMLRQFEALVPDFIARYMDAFASSGVSPTLVHQDSGCCNIHMTENGPVIYDWADVVVGHPFFSCDRLLDQVPAAYRDAVIDAFCATLGLSRESFAAMGRSNVLHEVLRYHDELEWLDPDDPTAESLSNSVRSQIRVLVEHELRRA